MKIKRIIDVLFSIVGIIALIPLTIYIVVLKIIFKDKSNIFFTQKRIGKDGKIFKIYKYNTMINQSEKMLEILLKHNEKLKNEYKTNRKLEEDPRITKIGKILRERNLDEFPQFINILKGDMSLVGPRPYMEKEKRYMGKYYDEIIKVKPGITGEWQIEKESKKQFKERLEIEAVYYKKHTLKEDMRIIRKTIQILFRSKNENRCININNEYIYGRRKS